MMEIAPGVIVQAFADITSGGLPVGSPLGLTDMNGNLYLPSAGDVLVIHNLTVSATTAVVGARFFYTVKLGVHVDLVQFTLAAGQSVSFPKATGLLITPAIQAFVNNGIPGVGSGLSIQPPANSRLILQLTGTLLSSNPQFQAP